MTITHPHERSRADQDDILLGFSDRLRDHPLLSSQTVVISDQPVPSQFPGGGFCVSVSAGPGDFPGELWDAAHAAQATEDGSIVVGCYTLIKRDRPGRREFALLGRRTQATPEPTQSRPSLIRWKKLLLQWLVLEDPTQGASSQAWEPSKDGRPLCRDIPIPRRVTEVLDVPDHPGWIGFQITFAVAWDWDLYSE